MSLSELCLHVYLTLIHQIKSPFGVFVFQPGVALSRNVTLVVSINQRPNINIITPEITCRRFIWSISPVGTRETDHASPRKQPVSLVIQALSLKIRPASIGSHSIMYILVTFYFKSGSTLHIDAKCGHRAIIQIFDLKVFLWRKCGK